jgi:hypothetical protein
MNERSYDPICRHTFELSGLMADHPPQLQHAHKKLVYNVACPPGTSYCGKVSFSRWQAIELPETFHPATDRTELVERADYFGYEPCVDRTQIEWYLNFAHSDVFCAYGGRLLAQDELQVAEHPALASLREALLAQGILPFTVFGGKPTPILVRGVERRVRIEIDPNPAAERPDGLYGNNFARATPAAIERAITPIDPPTISNIIAIEAPTDGYHDYTLDEIEYILVTAITGFTAARLESKGEAIVHTGYWGCGAYGGNRVLMALLQILAARIADLKRLVFHTGGAGSDRDLATAHQTLDRLISAEAGEIPITELLNQIYLLKFRWGVSDGN